MHACGPPQHDVPPWVGEVENFIVSCTWHPLRVLAERLRLRARPREGRGSPQMRFDVRRSAPIVALRRSGPSIQCGCSQERLAGSHRSRFGLVRPLLNVLQIGCHTAR